MKKSGPVGSMGLIKKMPLVASGACSGQVPEGNYGCFYQGYSETGTRLRQKLIRNI
jgi:hypothetical protein